MNSLNPSVEQQYTEWVYPEPVTDVAAWVAQGKNQICDPSLHHALLWPERAPDPHLSILVAGCGTSQAAMLAYTNPAARVMGIDLSPTSLAHTTALKAKHTLGNLELRRMDLHEAASLGQEFDLVYCTGVLHHLPDPQKGLEALSRAVKSDGVLCLMLYSKYLRAGVYMVQEALRRLEVGQTPEDVAFTRQVVGALPPWHTAKPYIEAAARDLVYDGGMVDTFLHPQDRAYSVPDILDLARRCNLDFHGWIDNLDYYPDGIIPADHPAYPRILALPNEEQWAVVELLVQFLGCHNFLLRKKKSDGTSARIDVTHPAFLQMAPAYRVGLKAVNGPEEAQLNRNWHRFSLRGLERDLLLAVNGRSTVQDIIAAQAKGGAAEDQARRFFTRMWRLGHFTFSRPSAA